jgi:hypothetical protein
MGHTTPHPPQFEVVLRGVSQPSQGSPSQFPKFWLHTGTQAVPTQSVVPLEFVQVLPQTPQWASLFVKFVSQPLPGVPSQLPKPAVHVPSVHMPLGHVSVAFARLHGVPHALQSVSVSMLVSHPSSGLPLQFRQKPLHTGAQSYVPGIPVQLVVPCPFVHVLPHEAQFAVVPRVVSQPFAAVQSPKPGLQPVEMHVPVAHDAVPFGTEHITPQLPQFASVVTLVSQPLSGLLSQLLQPISQTGEQSNVPGMPVQLFVP